MSDVCRFCGATKMQQHIYTYSTRHGVCLDCYRALPKFEGTVVTLWGRIFPESRRGDFGDSKILAVSRTTRL